MSKPSGALATWTGRFGWTVLLRLAKRQVDTRLSLPKGRTPTEVSLLI